MSKSIIFPLCSFPRKEKILQVLWSLLPPSQPLPVMKAFQRKDWRQTLLSLSSVRL